MHGIAANGTVVCHILDTDKQIRDELTAYEKFQPLKNNKFFWLL